MKYFVFLVMFPLVSFAEQRTEEVDYPQYVTRENVCITTQALFKLIDPKILVTCPTESSDTEETKESI